MSVTLVSSRDDDDGDEDDDDDDNDVDDDADGGGDGDDEGGGDDDNDVVLAPDPWTVRKTDVKEEEGTLRKIVAIRKTRRIRAEGTCTLFFFCRIFFTILSLNIG